MAKRFADLCSVEQDTGCFIWTGTLRSGRGQFRAGRRTVSAPQWAWEQVHGSLPEGRWLKAVCGNDAWVNPDHLEPVVPAETVGDHEPAKTHCPSGHPYSAKNIYITPNGQRMSVQDLSAIVTIL